MAIFKSKSTTIGLLAKGNLEDIFTPTRIIVDTETKKITVRKRNWYLIGVDEDVYAFSSIRHIAINNFLFGADIHIRMYGGQVIIYALSKKDAAEIKNLLI
jgi:hypothetical protein